MRKRRAFAVLLACSLLLSGNGMTVLAAETGVDQPVAVTQTEEPETSENTGETGEPPVSETSGAVQEPGESETPGTVQQPGEPQAPEESGTPEEAEKPDESETPEDTEKPGESGTPEDGETPEETEDPDVPKADEAEKEPVEDEEAEPVKEQEEPEQAASEVQNYVSRIVTFTDDTGMQVTYDANASTRYRYVVENGILTAVMIQSTTVSGNTTEEPAKFTGNVELRQPEEGEKYTSIAASVFGGNQEITYVKLPAGLETVGAGAFKGCTALKGLYLPAGVTKIENSAFENCTAMTQISVPKAVTTIGDAAFKGDARLHLIHIKDKDYCDLTTIGESAFEGCATLAEFCSDTGFVVPEKLQSIGKSAFKGCKSITGIDFSGTALSSLGTNAFEGCTGLKDLNMGDNISEIPQYAFAGCSGLMSLIIQQGNDLTVDSYAFKDCFSLKQLVLPQSVRTVCDNAFQGCSNLARVEVHNFTMNFGASDGAFPLTKLAFGAKRLFIVNRQNNGKMSSGEIYARNHSDVVDFEYFDGGKDQLYDCVIEGEDPVKKDGAITGGKIWVETLDGDKKLTKVDRSKGLKSDDTKYYIFYEENTDFVLVSGSLRCNGEPVQKDETKRYCFTMPVGGVIITAEFAPKATDKIKGTKVTVEYSNGEPTYVKNSNGELTCNGVSLKVGQTTRMFLIDEDGEAIPSSKIESIESSEKKVATVSKSGVITTVGTNGSEKGETEITAILMGENNLPVTVSQKIIVIDAQAASIALKATKYEPQLIKIKQSEQTGIQTASISKNNVAGSGLEITLKANVYTAEQENISKGLAWTTSNSSVAKVSTAKTEGKNPVNVVEVQPNCEGEAIITATAVNAANKKVTQKFIIQVYQQTYKLVTTAITVNPYSTAGGEIEVIGAYGQDVSDATVELWREEKDQKTKKSLWYVDTNFRVTALNAAVGSTTKKFRVEVNSKDTISNKTYNLHASLNGNTETRVPIKITVKRSAPNPTVKFNANKAKFNLFYKNGGTDAEGAQVSVITEITKLGSVKLKDAKLEPLTTTNEDDALFTKNFEIDRANMNLADGKIPIKRSAEPLQYTKQKKAAVTGYLVLYFEGYEDSAAKKIKVTMPTATTAPSWALRTAKGTYRADVGSQSISLELFDKKSKKKEQVMLDKNYAVDADGVDEVSMGDEKPSIENGFIKIKFVPGKGSIRLTLKNPAWDLDQNGRERALTFTYNVAVSSNKPVIKPDQNTVTLNLNYPEKTAQFRLVSNLGGVEINEAQFFEPKITNANADQIQNLKVTYENGVGTVSIESGKTVKKGTYKFECFPNGDTELKKAVLTIKVADVKPGVKFGKGSLQLNGVVYANNETVNKGNKETNTSVLEDEEYREVSERSFKVTGVPEGYQLAPVGSEDDETSVVGAMPAKPGIEKNFDFAVEEDPSHEKDDVLKVSLKETVAKGTYKFKLTPRYVKEGMKTISAQTVDFQVKVLSERDIFVNVTAKGKINLVNREGEANDKNGILYTPALKNIVGEIGAVKIYDAGTMKESKYFDISLIREGKDAGKFFVTPKKPVLTQKPDGSPEYVYPELENNKQYPVRIWVQVKGYAGNNGQDGGVMSKLIRIKAAQVLPKVTLSRSSMDVFLSTKNYNASFVAAPKEGSVGIIEDVYFAENDELANDSFELIKEPQADGSMKVTVHLKEAVGFANGTVNSVKFYVKYKGQGTNTSEKATGFTMKIKVN